MTASPQPQTTKSGFKTAPHAHLKKYPNQKLDRDLLLEVYAGKQYGSWTVLNAPVPATGAIRLVCSCSGCRREYLVALTDMLNGKSAQCKSCARKLSPNSPVLGRRFDAIWQKCNDPTHPNWATYGAQGIKCLFPSRASFILWVEANLPHPDYKGVELDRINNYGHYMPGNLRLATRRENANNRRTTVKVLYAGNLIPRTVFMEQHPECGYGTDTIGNLVSRGFTGEQIITRFATKYKSRSFTTY